jgi:glycosyltransferase involved in cell wall biosynthesis
LDLPAAGTLVLYLGRLAGYKGVGDLLEAWAGVRGATLVVVGEPALDDPVPVPTASPTLLVRGWTADVAGYLAACDVLVQPSHAEGMSNSTLEGMAAGLSIVSTDVGAAREMLGDDAGVIVPARNPRALAGAIGALVDDAERRASLGRRAREIVEARYGIEAVVSAIESAYAAMLQERDR